MFSYVGVICEKVILFFIFEGGVYGYGCIYSYEYGNLVYDYSYYYYDYGYDYVY